MYTRSSIPPYLDGTIDEEARARVEMLRPHDVFFTFAENIAAPDCLIPTELFQWIPTRQPVVLECFAPARVPLEARRRVLTTVASWEPTEGGPVVKGITYRGKSAEFERFIDLPSRSALPLELALSGKIPSARLREHGWRVRDAYEVSYDPWGYSQLSGAFIWGVECSEERLCRQSKRLVFLSYRLLFGAWDPRGGSGPRASVRLSPAARGFSRLRRSRRPAMPSQTSLLPPNSMQKPRGPLQQSTLMPAWCWNIL